MMYCEFVNGTGCRDNAHNYKVFQNLEIMYMNSDMTKAEIYEYGKKLVDNSKTEEELKLEQEIKEEIERYKTEIARYTSYVESDEVQLGFWKEENEKDMISQYRSSIRFWKQEIKTCKTRINELKWVLG